MDDMQPLLSPIVQYGFAGFCGVLVAFNFWLVKRLIEVIEANAEATRAAMVATQKLNGDVDDLHDVLGKVGETTRLIHERLLSRPCQIKEQ